MTVHYHTVFSFTADLKLMAKTGLQDGAMVSPLMAPSWSHYWPPCANDSENFDAKMDC